jgi:hypothetical protein
MMSPGANQPAELAYALMHFNMMKPFLCSGERGTKAPARRLACF